MIEHDTSTLVMFSQLFIAFCVGLSSIEVFINRRVFQTGELLDWEVNQLAYPKWCHFLNINVGQVNVIVLQTIRLIFALVIIYQSLTGHITLLPLIVGIIAQLIHCYRAPIGKDGSDQMVSIVLFGLFLFYWQPSQLVQELGIFFISIQIILAYCVSGVAKWFSPLWRNEPILKDILDTRSYGNKFVAKWLNEHPLLCRFGSLLVMTYQASFPLVIILPPEGVYFYLALGFLFHLSIAIVMGLNTFLWSFLACYPILLIGLDLLHRYYPWLQLKF